MTVKIIGEENHGIIGVAKNYTCAIQWLIDNDWINENTECYDPDDETSYLTLKERFGNNWQEKLFALDQDQFQDLFEESLIMTDWEVIGT